MAKFPIPTPPSNCSVTFGKLVNLPAGHMGDLGSQSRVIWKLLYPEDPKEISGGGASEDTQSQRPWEVGHGCRHCSKRSPALVLRAQGHRGQTHRVS